MFISVHTLKRILGYNFKIIIFIYDAIESIKSYINMVKSLLDVGCHSINIKLEWRA